MNLYELIKSHNFSGLEPNFVRNIASQLLACINFLQNNNIIHCDLKPENILLTEWNKNFIKVIDFGSSCFDSEKLYAYIQSRYYRAPEVILGLGYNPQIDMWSLGCVLAELFTGNSYFYIRDSNFPRRKRIRSVKLYDGVHWNSSGKHYFKC